MSATLWRGVAVLLAALLIAAGVGIICAHSAGDQEGFERATSERAARDAVAIVARVRDNAVLSIKQENINQIITRTKNEETAPVVQRIYVDRVRVGAGTCGSTSAAATDGASVSDGANSSGRLVRDDVERDTRALTEAVEQDLATGRACQAFVRENGMAP
jgi:prophage endopeptidase